MLCSRPCPLRPVTLNYENTDASRNKPFFLANLFQAKQPQFKTQVSKKDPSLPTEKKPKFAKDIHNPRKHWRCGSIIEVYSRSNDCWFTGKVEGIGYDEDGEFFEIHYSNHKNGKSMIKYINRYDPHLRSIQSQTPILRVPVIGQNHKKKPIPKTAPSIGPKRNSVRKTQMMTISDLTGTKGSISMSGKSESTLHRSLLPQEVIDELINDKCMTNEYSNMISSTCSETMNSQHTAETPTMCWDDEIESDNEDCAEMCTDTTSEESDSESTRHAWLNNEEFEEYFKCRLSAFLSRVRY